MAIKSTVVIHNAATKKHEPLAAGDKLAGSVIQLSSDAGNSITTGTDGGLLVATVAALPDDQVLTGDNSGSVNLTLTPATQPNGDVNYTVKGDVKINPAAGNSAVATSAGLYVPTPVVPSFAAGNAPAVVDDGTTTTQYFGGNTLALGNPTGWEKRAGTTKVYPLYDEGSVSGGATSITSTSSKKVEFGKEAITSTGSYQMYIIQFSTPFPSIPFVTLSSSIREDAITWKALNITKTGFTLEGSGWNANTFTGDVNWKAEEK